tara:strand:- start:1223 stop:2137 length:915 start_codon:yes stop_codon:yes gene_type:complete
MSLSITTTFAGTQSLPYVSASLFQGKTLENNWVKIYTDIKKSTVISKMDFGNLVQAYAASFNASGTLTKGECVLTPTDLMVNFEYDKKQLESDWESMKMNPGAGKSAPPAEFVSYVLDLMGRQTSQEVEFNLWRGNFTGSTSTLSGYTKFTGILRTIDTCAGTVKVNKTGAFSATNITTNIDLAFAQVPGQLLDKEDLGIYVSPSSAMMYKQALAGFSNESSYAKDYSLNYLGKEIRPCAGVPNDMIVVAQPGAIAFGTDLTSDSNSVRIVDLSDTTGSLTLRYRSDFKAGICVPYCTEVVWVR